jgi:hypothetical protein
LAFFLLPGLVLLPFGLPLPLPLGLFRVTFAPPTRAALTMEGCAVQ